jgi:hypothetical protein
MIQWILNYPNIRILLSSGTGDQVHGFLKEIKGHFQFNDILRWLYPEYCPNAKNMRQEQAAKILVSSAAAID